MLARSRGGEFFKWNLHRMEKLLGAALEDARKADRVPRAILVSPEDAKIPWDDASENHVWHFDDGDTYFNGVMLVTDPTMPRICVQILPQFLPEAEIVREINAAA